jgi:YHYH protein
MLRALVAALALAVCAGAAWAATGTTPHYATTPTAPGAVDPTAIPLGDGYVASAPKVGYVDSCTTAFGAAGGAQVAGPWIDAATRTWDERTKIAVSGSVSWPAARYSVKVAGSRRTIAFDDLPSHPTGVFPIAATDPAYAYDRNPNHIAAQTANWSLPLHPAVAARPMCLPLGPIGVLTDGAYLYDALDGEGRDAGAHEVLDACAGHPDMSSSYHHHDVPPCLLDRAPNGTATLVGYALDGFGVYVVKDAAGALPGNASLDACHGTTSTVPWNGRPTRIYHYVATLEYPYTVGCFHGAPIHVARASSGGPPLP